MTKIGQFYFSIVTVGSSEIIINDLFWCDFVPAGDFLVFLFIIKKTAVLGFDFFLFKKKTAVLVGTQIMVLLLKYLAKNRIFCHKMFNRINGKYKNSNKKIRCFFLLNFYDEFLGVIKKNFAVKMQQTMLQNLRA